jgi:parvulin-like peptidyl-prolyl isomerase
MKKACLIFTTILWATLILVTSCAKKENLVVANVGEEKITWSEFKEGYLQSPQFRRFKEDSAAKHDYLNTLIQEKLMIKEALRQGLDQSETIKEEVEKTEGSLMLRDLYEQEIVNAVITDSETREFYNRSGEEVRARHILIKAPSSASPDAREQARAKIDSLHALATGGGDFAQLAEENSEDPGSAAKGGDLGFFGWGKMVGEFQQAAFSLKTGQISDVIETQYGYHIIKVEEKRDVERQSYEEMKSQLRNQLQGQKKGELQAKAEAYVEDLKVKNNLVLNEENLNLLSQKKTQGNATLESLTDEEKSAVLVSYKGGEMTMADYLEWETTIPEKVRARATDIKGLTRQIEGKLINEFLVAKAKALGLNKKDTVVQQVRKRRDDLMVKELNTSIENSVKITEEDVQSYFEQHKDEYVLPEQVNIREIMVKDKALAENLLGRMKRGANIASLAEEHSERSWAAKKGGEFGFFTENQYGPLGTEAFKLKVGEFGGPIKVQGGYSVFKVIDRQKPRPQTYDEARPVIERKLELERKEAAFEDFVASLREQTPVDIDVEVLTMRVTEEQPNTAEEQQG